MDPAGERSLVPARSGLRLRLGCDLPQRHTDHRGRDWGETESLSRRLHSRCGSPPTRVFSQKRLQSIEDKGRERGKEREETTKRLQVSENMGFATEALRRRGPERNVGGVVHPRGDRKSAETIENRRDGGAPLRKRVRNRMKLLGLQGCDRKQRG